MTARDGDQFGFSLALSDDGNTVAHGAIAEDSNATGVNGNQADNSANSAGAVYVFARTGTTWSQQAYIKSSTPAEYANGDLFGFSVALNANGSTLAIGAYDEGGSSRTINGRDRQYARRFRRGVRLHTRWWRHGAGRRI